MKRYLTISLLFHLCIIALGQPYLEKSKFEDRYEAVECKITYDSIMADMSSLESYFYKHFEDEYIRLQQKLVYYLSTYMHYTRFPNELDKYTFVFEFSITKDGNMQSARLINTSFESANDQYLIDYFMKMPQCKFWEQYTGPEKEDLFTFPLRIHVDPMRK